MKDETRTTSPEFEAFVERLDPDTRAFLDKLRSREPCSEEQFLRSVCESHREMVEDAEAFAERLRRHDDYRPEIDALTERLRRVEDLVSRFKILDEGR
jgi:hypothetical protein